MALPSFLHPCEAMQTISNARPTYGHTKYIHAHIIPKGLPEPVCHRVRPQPHRSQQVETDDPRFALNISSQRSLEPSAPVNRHS